MIYLNVPVGGIHGWGICGKHLAREMARLAPVRLITLNFSFEQVGDELECQHLRTLVPASVDHAELSNSPLLQTIAGKDLLPIKLDLKARFAIGYTFIEDTRLPPANVENARRHFNVVVAGSSWCADVLRRHGLSDVRTIIQGIDPTAFFPLTEARQLLQDKFLVFSGGKFELRKGQDIVIRAFKVLQDRHPDVMLVTAWYNQWPFSWETMRLSPYIRFEPNTNQYFPAINKVQSDNGIDSQRVINLSPRFHTAFAPIYRNMDVGLFPNRCEGGTNLVLMEFMACGRPVIATSATGHADVVNESNAMLIGCRETRTHVIDNAQVDWPEPDLEQTIELLEHAYRNREKTAALGERSASDLAQLTWARAAGEFHKLLS